MSVLFGPSVPPTQARRATAAKCLTNAWLDITDEDLRHMPEDLSDTEGASSETGSGSESGSD